MATNIRSIPESNKRSGHSNYVSSVLFEYKIISTPVYIIHMLSYIFVVSLDDDLTKQWTTWSNRDLCSKSKARLFQVSARGIPLFHRQGPRRHRGAWEEGAWDRAAPKRMLRHAVGVFFSDWMPLFWLKAIFRIRVMRSGSKFAGNYRGGGGGLITPTDFPHDPVSI